MTGARSDAEAHRAARKVADSLLVKCSINGEDPYWGRVASELGSAGVDFDMDRADHRLRRDRRVPRAGSQVPYDEAAVAAHLAGSMVRRSSCGLGPGRRHGRGPGCRPRLRLHRREPDDVVTAALTRPATRSQPAGDKAAVLVESLPYIRRFWGKVVVVKYGGNVLDRQAGTGRGRRGGGPGRLRRGHRADALGRACCRWWSTAAGPRSARSWSGWARRSSSATGSG